MQLIRWLDEEMEVVAWAATSVAVDIGGAFLDLVCLDQETGEIRNAKVPSTLPTFIDGVIHALEKVGVSGQEMAAFKHGSTIATNAIIQWRGGSTALLTTEGFRDALGAARADRTDHFDLPWVDSPPLISRRDVIGVTERVDHEGTVVTPLDTRSLENAVALLSEKLERYKEARPRTVCDSFNSGSVQRKQAVLTNIAAVKGFD